MCTQTSGTKIATGQKRYVFTQIYTSPLIGGMHICIQVCMLHVIANYKANKTRRKPPPLLVLISLMMTYNSSACSWKKNATRTKRTKRRAWLAAWAWTGPLQTHRQEYIIIRGNWVAVLGQCSISIVRVCAVCIASMHFTQMHFLFLALCCCTWCWSHCAHM